MIEITNYNDLLKESKNNNDSLIEYIKCKIDSLYRNYEKNNDNFKNIGINKILIFEKNIDKLLINNIANNKEWIDEIIIDNEIYWNICVKNSGNVVTEIYVYSN